MDKGQKFSAGFFIVAIIIAWLFAEFVYKPYVEGKSEVPYSEFLQDLEANAIEAVDLGEDRITYTLKPASADAAKPSDRPIVDGVILNVKAFTSRKGKAASSTKNVVRLLDPLLIERLASADVAFGGISKNGFSDMMMGIL
ncbi:MAG: ATP-dependent metallopeptidase FtsH/Yme1/Tma family protein, partial [Synergistaceae bacterium]|nr:ATP-dependent metallopeptidase FtsH/Yme1/Tma family protein [Synergistaceae bacterium]